MYHDVSKQIARKTRIISTDNTTLHSLNYRTHFFNGEPLHCGFVFLNAIRGKPENN